jgi:hypothetical protein
MQLHPDDRCLAEPHRRFTVHTGAYIGIYLRRIACIILIIIIINFLIIIIFVYILT